MLEAVRSLVPGIKVGKILIQRDESEEKLPKMFCKVPALLPGDRSSLCDPMLATGVLQQWFDYFLNNYFRLKSYKLRHSHKQKILSKSRCTEFGMVEERMLVKY